MEMASDNLILRSHTIIQPRIQRRRSPIMSGVWVFRKGVMSREKPSRSSLRRKVLVHLPSNETVTSVEMLEAKLAEEGWQRYPSASPDLVQFHKPSTVDLISVPADFDRLTSVHMYDVVVKCRNVFAVRDA